MSFYLAPNIDMWFSNKYVWFVTVPEITFINGNWSVILFSVFLYYLWILFSNLFIFLYFCFSILILLSSNIDFYLNHLNDKSTLHWLNFFLVLSLFFKSIFMFKGIRWPYETSFILINPHMHAHSKKIQNIYVHIMKFI